MRAIAKGVFVISFILALGAAHAARAGMIEGSVKDGKTGAALVGAAIRVVGTDLGATTDLDGRFAIASVPAGVYSLRVTCVGYTQKVIAGIAVDTVNEIKLDISTTQGDAMRIDDTYVTAQRVRTTNAALLTQRQQASVIGDAISAEQIRLSPDGSSSDALKRITGLSVVDDKFVFVRGVTDRYNSTTLNGVTVTGTDTDSDKKSFSFDMIPSSLISSTVVAKTATPDLPGDFSGGLVQVNTLDFPADFMLTAGIEQGNDVASSRQDFLRSTGGGSDWKAKDDGSRALPTGVEGNALAQALPNTWGTHEDDSHMNGSYGLAVGSRWDVGGGALGFIASGMYKNNYKIEEFSQEPEYSGSPLFDWDGMRYKHKFQAGGLASLGWHPSTNHRFRFENNLNRTAEDKVSQVYGVAESRDSTRVQSIEWDQRDLYLGQVTGDHTLPSLGGLEIHWNAAYNTSNAQEPDRKIAAYSRTPSGIYILKENLRTWSEIDETGQGAQIDAEFPVGDGFVKAGYATGHRERASNTTAYTTDPSGVTRANQNILTLPIDEVFSGENYGTGKFSFEPSSSFTGVYDGESDLNAYYGMIDSPFTALGHRFRGAGGARVEDFTQTVNSPVSVEDPTVLSSTLDNSDVLPSANLTWQLADACNVRLGYFASVNRPEFREMANVIYFDFDQNQYVIGNSELKRARIDNYDVRLEWFPKLGDVVAVSWFDKRLDDAIEEQLLPAPDRYVRTWFNSTSGRNFGYEIELRKSLGFVWGGLENVVVQGNYTHVESEVEYEETYTDEVGTPITEVKTRPLQGQAPYTANAGLVWSMPDIGLSASFLFNRFGRRLDAVGRTRSEDLYEEPRNVFDFALTEQFTPWMRLKFTVKDITSEDIVTTFGDTGSTWERVKTGTTYALSLSFSL